MGQNKVQSNASPSDLAIDIYEDELYEHWLAGDVEAGEELYLFELMERDD